MFRGFSKIVFFIYLGIDSYTKVINIGDERVRLQIWYKLNLGLNCILVKVIIPFSCCPKYKYY